MRIAVFSDNFYPELSGIADSIVMLVRELAGPKFFFDIYAPRYSPANFKTAKLPQRELALGPYVQIHRLWALPAPSGTKQGRMVLPTGLRFLGMRTQKPDLVHTHSFFGLGLEALCAAKFLGVPLIGTSHTPISEFLSYGPSNSKSFANWSLKAVSWYYNHCKFVTAPSKSILTEMELYGFGQPSEVISNPIELSLFSPPSEAQKNILRKKYELAGPVVLYSGRLAPEKHIDVILRAFAPVVEHSPKARLILTGFGSSESSLRSLAEELGLSANVWFTGFVSVEMLAELYQAADIFAIASTAETQSIALMQALSSGLPAVGVRARALPEYITEQNGALVAPGDFTAMTQAFLRLLSDRTLYENLSLGAARSTQNFSVAHIRDTWAARYASFVTKPSAGVTIHS